MPRTQTADVSGLFAESALLLQHLPDRDADTELVILKLHLIVETSLRAYVDGKLPNPAEFTHYRFLYSQIVVLCRSLAPKASSEWIFDAAKLLNDARNRYAHELAPTDIERILTAFTSIVEAHLKNPAPPIGDRGDKRLYMALLNFHTETLLFLNKK